MEELKSAITVNHYLDENYCCYSLYHERDMLHSIEVFQYVKFHLTVLSKLDDLSRIEAFVDTCNELDMQGQEKTVMVIMLEFIKLKVIHNYLTR